MLPSPNGSSIAFAADQQRRAGGRRLPAQRGGRAAGTWTDSSEWRWSPAGEQWGDGSLRPAYEDLVGAGAIIDRLTGRDPGLGPDARGGGGGARVPARCGRWSRPSGAELVRAWLRGRRATGRRDRRERRGAGRGPSSRPEAGSLGLSSVTGAAPRTGATSRRSRPESDSCWRARQGREQLLLALEQVGERGVDRAPCPAAVSRTARRGGRPGRAGAATRPRSTRAGRCGWSSCRR